MFLWFPGPHSLADRSERCLVISRPPSTSRQRRGPRYFQRGRASAAEGLAGAASLSPCGRSLDSSRGVTNQPRNCKKCESKLGKPRSSLSQPTPVHLRISPASGAVCSAQLSPAMLRRHRPWPLEHGKVQGRKTRNSQMSRVLLQRIAALIDCPNPKQLRSVHVLVEYVHAQVAN